MKFLSSERRIKKNSGSGRMTSGGIRRELRTLVMADVKFYGQKSTEHLDRMTYENC